MPNGGTNVAQRTLTGSGAYSTDGDLVLQSLGGGQYARAASITTEIGLNILRGTTGPGNTGNFGPLFTIKIQGFAQRSGLTVPPVIVPKTTCTISTRAGLTGIAFVSATGTVDQVGAGIYSWSIDTTLDITFRERTVGAVAGEPAIRKLQMVVIERARIGGSFNCSVTLPGGTVVSIGGTINGTFYMDPSFSSPLSQSQQLQNFAIDGYVYADFYNNALSLGRTSAAAHVTAIMADEALGCVASGSQHYIVDTTATIDFASGCAIEVEQSLGMALAVSPQGRFSFGSAKTMTVLSGLDQMDEAYPSTLAGVMQTENGSTRAFALGSATVGLRNIVAAFDPMASAAGNPGSTTAMPTQSLYLVNDGFSVSFGLNAGDMAAAKESLDQLMPIRLAPFDAMTLSRAASYVFDACDNATGWTNGALTGGNIRIDSAANGGVGEKVYATSAVSEAFRYLDLQIKPLSSSAQPYTVEIWSDGAGLKKYRYEAVTGASGSFSTQRIDLLAPVDQVDGLDLADSRWPTLGAGSDIPTAEGNQWGINRIAKIRIMLPVSTGSYDIREMSLEQANASKISFLTSLRGSKLSNAPSDPLVFRGIIGETDGRRSLEMYVYTSNGVRPTLAQGKAQIDKITGWTCALLSTHNSKWYYDNALCFAGGNGIIYTGQGTILDEDRYLHREVPTSPTTMTIEGQAMVTGASLPPRLGSLLIQDGGSLSDHTTIALYKILRPQLSGVAIDIDRQPVVGETVTINEIGTGNFAGPGTTDAEGAYLSTADYPTTAPAQVVKLLEASVTVQLAHREMRRISFGVAPVEGAPWQIQDRHGRVHLATLKSGDVKYRRSDHTVPLPEWALAEMVTDLGDCEFAAMAIDPATSRILMLIERLDGSDYSIWSCYSDSDGQDFSEPELFMADARFGVPWSGNDGSMGMTWFEYDTGSAGPGVQKAQHREEGDAAWSATFTFKDESGVDIVVADLGWSNVQEAVDGTARLTWCPVLDGQTAPTFHYSTDRGRTWTPL